MNWGIVGTGNIAGVMARDFKFVQDSALVGVTGTSLLKAEQFAVTHGVHKAYESLEALLEDKNLECVYVATPHTSHKEIAIKAMKAGKHVLCEKPMGINEREEMEMIRVAKEEKVFLMEGFWTCYLPAVMEMIQWIKDGEIGRVRHIEADFSFRLDEEKGRLFDPALGGGALLDVGIYVVGMTHVLSRILDAGDLGVMHHTVQKTESGVDGQDSILMQYESGLSASLTCGVTLEGREKMTVYGEKGHIELPNFYRAKKACLYTKGDCLDYNSNTGAAGYAYEVSAMNELIKKGSTESPVLPLSQSLEVSRLLDTLRSDIGIQYPSEIIAHHDQ